jgi:TRAP-type C4-dicarboxylate transport system substrate-binding protein
MHRMIPGFLIVFMLAPGAARAEVMKLATVAPEQSTWMQVMRDCEKELREATNGAVELRLYPGGVSGDEKDVLRKMRFGQLSAGGLSGFGLGEIVPWVRVLELPFLIETPDEAAAALDVARDTLETAFAREGFEVLGWSSVGLIHIFSQHPIVDLETLRHAKMWLWEGDRLALQLFKEADVSPIQVALPDVITALDTGLLDAVYTSPLALLALQWFTRVRYMTDLPLAHSVGAVVVSSSFMRKLGEPTSQTVRDVFASHMARLDTLTRRDQLEALQVLKESGIETAEVSPQARSTFKQLGKKVSDSLSGDLVPGWLVKEIERAVAEHRRKTP